MRSVFLSNSLAADRAVWLGSTGLDAGVQVRAWRSSTVRTSTVGMNSNGRLRRRGSIQDLPGKEHTPEDSRMTCSPLV